MISLSKAPRSERNDDGAYMYSFFRFGAEHFCKLLDESDEHFL